MGGAYRGGARPSRTEREWRKSARRTRRRLAKLFRAAYTSSVGFQTISFRILRRPAGQGLEEPADAGSGIGRIQEHGGRFAIVGLIKDRSEEHTSELQSPMY